MLNAIPLPLLTHLVDDNICMNLIDCAVVYAYVDKPALQKYMLDLPCPIRPHNN